MDDKHVISRRTVTIAMAASASLLIVGGGSSVHALNSAEAEGFVTEVVGELRALVDNDRSGAAGAAEFLSLLDRRASVDAVGRFAMGRNWRQMSDQQKTAFAEAFRSYISNTYQRRFGEYAGEDIEVTGSLDAGKKGVLVKSVLKRPNGADVTVEWLVSDRSGATLLSDIIFEGVSLAITLRETFAGMLERRNGDLDGFIADLESSNGA